ncbi:MAG: hypothetical protein ACFB50_02975 [Rubrobacteraceae bacterium]
MSTPNGGEQDLHQLDLNLHPNEASGLLTIENQPLLESHDWEYGFWVVMDEAEAEYCVGAIGHKRGASINEGWEIDRLHAEPHFIGPKGGTEDAESVTRDDGWIYVFGSQHGGKRGPVDPEEAWVARFREEEVSHAFEDPAVNMEISRTDLVLHRVINDALKASGPELLPQGPATYEAFITRSREDGVLADLVREDDVTINIEGTAFRDDGSLLVGLRYPLEAEGRPLLADIVGIERLFEPGDELPEVTGFTWVAAVGREGTVAGVRDLAIVGDELHLVTGNIDSKQKNSVVLEDHPGGRDTVATHFRCALPEAGSSGLVEAEFVREFPSLPRVEGIAITDDGGFFYVTDEDEGVHLRLTRLLGS